MTFRIRTTREQVMDQPQKSTLSADSEALARRCVAICEERKAEDLMLFDVRESSILADYYLVCTGTSAPHISALCNHLRQDLAREGVMPQRREGDPESHWVIMDYGVVLVHIMDPERRRFYRIEDLWENGRLVHQSDGARPVAARQA